MERKRVIELGIAIAILSALIFLVWWMLRDVREPDSEIAIETAQDLPKTNTTTAQVAIDPEEVPRVQEVSAGTVARTFVERIGSYSSESDYQNVDDVLGIVTDVLKKQLEKDAEKARAQAPEDNGGYYGISTSYVGAKTTEESETQITLLVQTQREESFGSPGNSEVRYQQVEVTLVKEGSEWRVDSYTWKD
jgi:hypothetical protein